MSQGRKANQPAGDAPEGAFERSVRWVADGGSPEPPLPDTARACPKCGAHGKEQGEFRAAGGFFASFFDVSTRRFRYLSCTQCGFTEFYSASLSGKLFDFLADG